MKTLTMAEKREQQAAGIKYGCHIDLGPDEQPDGCVIDEERRDDCAYGYRHRTREGCPYWQPIRSAK